MVKAMDKADLIIADLALNATNPKTRAMYQFIKQHREAKLASQGIGNPSEEDACLLIPCHGNRPKADAEEFQQDQNKNRYKHEAGG
jgi:hypothetical protein